MLPSSSGTQRILKRLIANARSPVTDAVRLPSKAPSAPLILFFPKKNQAALAAVATRVWYRPPGGPTSSLVTAGNGSGPEGVGGGGSEGALAGAGGGGLFILECSEKFQLACPTQLGVPALPFPAPFGTPLAGGAGMPGIMGGISGVGSCSSSTLGGAMLGSLAKRRGQISRLFHMAWSSRMSAKDI